MALTATLNPSVFGLGGQGGITSEDNIVFTYKMAASSSASKGDGIKLSDTSSGTVGKVTATGDAVIGVAAETVDNSTGAAGDKYISVIRQGVVEIDGIVAASAMNATIFFDSPLYLCHANTDPAVSAGAALTATDSGGDIVGMALDAVPVPDATALYRMRVFIDKLNEIIN